MRLFLVNSFILIIFLSLMVPGSARAAPEFSTKAEYAFVLDYNTLRVLYQKASDQKMAPSSMTKLMTLYILFDKIKNGSMTLEDELPVSEKAWRKGGSKMFVEVGKTVKVEDLIQGIIVQSGNDACIVVAEAISGSEEAFAGEMNAYAKKLGLKGSHFTNSTGWPDKEHYMTARDLGVLTMKLIGDFREFYHYFGESEFTYSGIKQHNRNNLVVRNKEIDGLKTGHTEDGGYGMVISGKKYGKSGKRRVVVVVNGLSSQKEREVEAERLFNYAMRNYDHYIFYLKEDKVSDAKVWMGDKETVPVVSLSNIIFTLSNHNIEDTKVTVSYKAPLVPPIVKGDQIAELHILKPDELERTIPLYAGEDIRPLSFFGHLFKRMNSFLFGND